MGHGRFQTTVEKAKVYGGAVAKKAKQAKKAKKELKAAAEVA